MARRSPHNPDQVVMSFGDHLDDLRKRLIFALLGLLPILVVALIFGNDLLALLIRPLEDQLLAAGLPPQLQALSPTETFLSVIKVALIAAILAGGPWILYQVWLFVAPGLYVEERRFVYFLVPLSTLLTVGGVLFLYYILLPLSLRFLILFSIGVLPAQTNIVDLPPDQTIAAFPVLEGDPRDPEPGQVWINRPLRQLRVAVAVRPVDVGPAAEVGGAAAESVIDAPAPPETDAPPGAAPKPRIRILGAPLTTSAAVAQQYRLADFVNLVLLLGLVFAIAFQLPLVLMLLGWTGLLAPADLRGKRKMVLFICAVAGAIMTPADPISMIALTLPLYGLFELGLVLMRFVPASRVAAGVRGDKPEPTKTDGQEGDA